MVMALFWSATALVPLLVLFSMRDGVAGWSAHEALIVVGFFMALKGVLPAPSSPRSRNVVEHIRKGTLDFLLLKPVDAQFLLSTSKLELVARQPTCSRASRWSAYGHSTRSERPPRVLARRARAADPRCARSRSCTRSGSWW